MFYLLLFHVNNGYAKALRCQIYLYITRLVGVPANHINACIRIDMYFI